MLSKSMNRFTAASIAIIGLLGLITACNPKVTPPGLSGLVVHVTGGGTVLNTIDISTVQVITLDIHPQNKNSTATATSGTVTINNQSVNGTILAYNSDQSHAGDLTANLDQCVHIRSGKNIKVDYTFSNANKDVLEQGSVYLSEVIGSCP